MISKVYEAIVKDPNFRSQYTQGMSHLWQSNVFTFLREIGRSRLKPNMDLTALATEAARSAGFNECLDALINFEELYLTDKSTEEPNLDYGGTALALQRGDLTEKDLEQALKASKQMFGE